MNQFQERLLELMNEFQLNRLQLSKLIGITSTTINGYFNNGYYPQIDIAIKLSNFFNCSLNYLFGLSDERDCNDTNKNTFIENFHNLIKENNQSIAKTLADLKMSEYNYYRWKKGMFPKTSNLLEIAKYFDVSVDYLIGRSYIE